MAPVKVDSEHSGAEEKKKEEGKLRLKTSRHGLQATEKHRCFTAGTTAKSECRQKESAGLCDCCEGGTVAAKVKSLLQRSLNFCPV